MHKASVESLIGVTTESSHIFSLARYLAEKFVEPDEPYDGVGEVTGLLRRDALEGEGGAVAETLGHRVQDRPPHRGRALEAEAGHTRGQAAAEYPGLGEREVAADREEILPELEALGEMDLARHCSGVIGENIL